jgi:hypothetical protein
MSSSPSTIAEDVTVTLDDAVTKDTAPELATYLVSVELVTGRARRHVAVVCAAESRGVAAQIARDVNEEEQHAYVKTLVQIADLQIVAVGGREQRYPKP